MTNHKLINSISHDLWAILPDFLQTLYLSAIDFDLSQAQEPSQNTFIQRGSVAVIPVHGALGKNLDSMDKVFGMTDYTDIEQMLTEAEADPTINHVLLHIDSAGGTITGLPELTSRMRAMKKPITAFTDGMAASAAYWLASQADHILVSETSTVGSIGVYIALLDQSRYLEMNGLKMNAISSGKYKLDYAPFKPLSKEAEERLQANVEKWHDRFKAEVNIKQNVPHENMEGQTFEGFEAVEANLASGVVNSISEVLTLLGES